MLLNTFKSGHGSIKELTRAILVVEDEEPIRACAAEFLVDWGYAVVEAANVAQAKKLLHERLVHVVFSDINMPGGETGFGLEKWVRGHYPNIKVLLTSGYPQVMEDTRDLLEPLIPKPYSLSAVRRRIAWLLRTEGSSEQVRTDYLPSAQLSDHRR